MCFIEFEKISYAKAAFRAYNKRVIPELCFVRIKFSNREKIISKIPKRKNT